MKIERVTATPVSFPVPPEFQVALGIGRSVKRDAVIVRVDSDTGVTGWGEAHAARAPTAIAELVNTTLAELVIGMDANDTGAVFDRVYRMQLASHGAGAAAAIGLSGIDMALWDLKGKAAGRPLYAMLGGSRRPIPAYAGGIALGFGVPALVADEARRLAESGYTALKLRIGEGPRIDAERVAAVRSALGERVVLLTDANTAYALADVAAVAPALESANVAWLEEPFPAHDYRSYRAAAGLTRIPLAAGENHYTRHDFERARDDGAIRVWQPDLSKTGGVTEALAIAGLAAEAGLAVHPHTSVTALNMAASLHFLAAIPNGGYFEADVSAWNPLRDRIADWKPAIAPDGTFIAPDGPGLGVEIDEELLARYPAIAGAGYV